MILNKEPVNVELFYAGELVDVTSTSASFVNERQKIVIDLKKTMEQDDIFNIGPNGEITNVRFGLYAAEDMTAADGRVIPKDALLETAYCDKDGNIVFATDLPVGVSVYVKEVATDCHYVLYGDSFKIDFDYAGQDTETVRTAANGGKARIRFYSETFNPPKMLELFHEYGITAFCGTPTLISMTARFKRESANDCLKHICISGECMDSQTGHRIAKAFPKCEIYHIYGLTEACPRVSYLPPNLFNRYPDFVGIPLKSVSVRIADKNGNPLPDGKEGILWVKGDNIMLGYYNEPDKTAEVLRDGWLCTGDIAVINDVGLLKIKGRNDGLIIKSGMNIYPSEIEAALKTDPRVKEVLAYGIESKHGMQIGLKIAGDFNSVSEVKKLCSECLPYFQIPNYIEIMPEISKNGSGKIIRR